MKYNLFIFTSLILVILFFSNYFNYFSFDYGDYENQINQILLGPWNKISNRYPPLTSIIYSIFIALFGIKIGVMFLHSTVLVLIFHYLQSLNNLLGCSNRITIFSSYISIFNPYIMSYFIRGVNSELVFILFLLFFLNQILDERKSNFYLTGFLLGLAFLTRQVAVFGFVFCFYHLINRNLNFRLILKLSLSFFLTIIPWSYYSNNVSGNFTSSGFKSGFRDGFSFNHKDFREPIKLPIEVSNFSDSFCKYYYSDNNVKSANEYDFVKNKVLTEPQKMLQVFVFKFFRTLYGVDSQNSRVESFNKVAMSTLLLLWFYLLFIKRKVASKRVYVFSIMVLIMFFCSMLLSTFVLSILRYQSVFIPLILVSISCLIHDSYKIKSFKY